MASFGLFQEIHNFGYLLEEKLFKRRTNQNRSIVIACGLFFPLNLQTKKIHIRKFEAQLGTK